MDGCGCEQSTQYKKSGGQGHGPVASQETIAFAVSDKTTIKDGRLCAASFSVSRMKNSNESIARTSFTTRRDFEEHVVKPLAARLGFRGIAVAPVGDIRTLAWDGSAPPLRAVCVADDVQNEDHDGHAVLGFGETLPTLPTTEKARNNQISYLRGLATANLGKCFGAVTGIDAAPWLNDESLEQSRLGIRLALLRSGWRILLCVRRALLRTNR